MASLLTSLADDQATGGAMRVGNVVSRYIDARRRDGTAASTVADHEYQLWRFVTHVGDMDVRRVGYEQVRGWVWDEPVQASTKRKRLSLLRVFFRWAVLNGYAAHNPAERIDAPRVPRRLPRALPRDAVSALLRVCPDSRARAVVYLMVELGLRRGEVASLERGDIDWRSLTIRVAGKGGHERVLPLTPAAGLAVDRYLREQPGQSGPLFRSANNPDEGLRPEWFSRTVTGLMRAAGIKQTAYDGVSAHALRHTAATDVLTEAGDLRVVQNMLGHASMQSTFIYTRMTSDVEQLRAVMSGRNYESGSDEWGNRRRSAASSGSRWQPSQNTTWEMRSSG